MSCIAPEDRYNHREAARLISVEEVSAAAMALFPDRQPPSVQALSGGYNNGNFLLDFGAERFLLRVFTGGRQVADREAGILERARAAGVKAPRVLGQAIVGGRAIALQEYVPGVLLSEVLRQRPPRECSATFASLGRELARIHSVRFAKPGIFSGAGEIVEIADSGLGFLHGFLEGRAGERLGPDLTAELLSFVDEEWPKVEASFAGPVLAHCDFNPKNILIAAAGGEVAAVLDWEFAIAGHPLIDLGNFLRFSDDYTEEERSVFIDEYQAAGGSLPDGWRHVARLVDLVSMGSFLAQPEEYPKTFRTARLVIEETLALRA